MKRTEVSPYDGTSVGYVLHTYLGQSSQKEVSALQQPFSKEFPDIVQPAEPHALHITLLDWLAPLVDYGEDKDDIFQRIFDEYDAAIQNSLNGIGSIEIEFNSLNVAPGAIFIKGEDSGQYQEIRNRFLGKVTLLPNTKMPPTIVHTTIARYKADADLGPIEEVAAGMEVRFTESISYFNLIRATGTAFTDFEIIKTYTLE